MNGYLIASPPPSLRRIVLPLMLSLLFSAPLSAQTAESYRQEALQLSRAKSWDQAALTYRKARALEPNDAVTHYNLALTLKYSADAGQTSEQSEARMRA